jgi:hypothetical protein
MNKAMLVSPALALTLTLAGCAAQQPQDGAQRSAFEEHYIPTGTMFATKTPKRTDAAKIIDKEGLGLMIQQNAGSNGPSKM